MTVDILNDLNNKNARHDDHAKWHKYYKYVESNMPAVNENLNIPIFHFSSIDTLKEYVGEKEILSDEDSSAYAKLFIKENAVIKIYVSNPSLAHRNIDILFSVISCSELRSNPYVVFPSALIALSGRIIGYVMPFIDGKTLDTYLYDSKTPYENIIDYLSQIASAINSLPLNIHIGDLHPKNIIVDYNNRIHLIDIDGFSVDDLHSMSCPLNTWSHFPNSPLILSKTNIDGGVVVTRKTDNICLILILLDYLLAEKRFSFFSIFEQRMYLLYLWKIAPWKFVRCVLRTFSKKDNVIYPESILCLKRADIKKLTFSRFVESVYIVNKINKEAEIALETIINEHGGKT